MARFAHDRPRARLILGSVAGLGAGVGYGAALALARLTYDYGVTPPILVLVRYVLLGLGLGLWLVLTRRLRRPPLRRLAAMLLIGGLSYLVTFANLSAILYIPVSLTTIIFYVHPALVVVASAVLARSGRNGVELAAVGGAFCGLFVALQVSFASLHPLGLALATLSAFSAASIYVLGNRLLRETDFVELTFYMALGATVISAFAMWPEGSWTMPNAAAGVLLMALVTLLFVVAITSMFLAIELIGPAPASMLTNVEPLTAIAVAVAVLGEALPLEVAFGAALVIAAILLMQASRARPPPPSPARRRAGSRRGWRTG